MSLLLANRLSIDIERMRSRALDFRSQIARHEARFGQLTNAKHRALDQQRIRDYAIAADALEQAIATLQGACDALNEQGGTRMAL